MSSIRAKHFVAEDRRGELVKDIPFGAAKWMTLPSSLNMFTSSIAWIGWTLSFLSDVCSFLSSVPDDLWTFLVLRRGVPFPLYSDSVSDCLSRRWNRWFMATARVESG